MSDLHGHMHVTLLFSLHVKQLEKNYLLKFTFASAIKLGRRIVNLTTPFLISNVTSHMLLAH